MSRITSPYDRHDGLMKSSPGVKLIMLSTAGLLSVGLHIVVLWVFLFLLSSPSSLRLGPEDYINVQLLGGEIPSAPAAPDVPVNPDLKGPDVVEATKSDPTLNQPTFAPTEAVPSSGEVIPLGPVAPEKPPEITKKAAPPKVTVPKVQPDPPPKKAETKPNQDAELNKTLAALQRKVEADKQREAQDAEKYNINSQTAGGSGEGSQSTGSSSGARIDPRMSQYFAHIQEIVERNWSWTSLPGIDESKLKALVEITIEPNGRISALKVVKSSGNQEFDHSVLRAINRSNPLPAPTPVFEGKTVKVILDCTPEQFRRSQR